MIHREDQGQVAVLRLEHGKANAIDIDFFDELDQRIDEAVASAAVQALVLTGTGGIFSAGVNLFAVRDGGRDYLERFLPWISSSLRKVFTLPLPVVAAVNGHAMAGGLILALAADYRVMADGKGKVGLTEIMVGVAFPVGALEIVRHQASDRGAADLILTGRVMPAAEALEKKLVDEIVPAETVVERAVEVAARYGALSRDAFAASKRHLRLPAVELMDRYQDDIDARVLENWSRPETLEGIGRFLDKTVGKS